MKIFIGGNNNNESKKLTHRNTIGVNSKIQSESNINHHSQKSLNIELKLNEDEEYKSPNQLE